MDGYWIHKEGQLTLNGVPLVNGLWRTVVVIIDVVANFLRGLDTNNRLGEGFLQELHHSHIQNKRYVECSLATEEVKAFVLSKLVRPFFNHLSCCDVALSQHSLLCISKETIQHVLVYTHPSNHQLPLYLISIVSLYHAPWY